MGVHPKAFWYVGRVYICFQLCVHGPVDLAMHALLVSNSVWSSPTPHAVYSINGLPINLVQPEILCYYKVCKLVLAIGKDKFKSVRATLR